MTLTYGEKLLAQGFEQGFAEGFVEEFTAAVGTRTKLSREDIESLACEQARVAVVRRLLNYGATEVDIAAYFEITVERVREFVAMSSAPAPLPDPTLR